MTMTRTTASQEPHECPRCHGERNVMASLYELRDGKADARIIECPVCKGTGLVWSTCSRTVTCDAKECPECPLMADLLLVSARERVLETKSEKEAKDADPK